MHTSATKLHTKRVSRSCYTHDHSPKWQVKKNQLLREGTILRWRTGHGIQNAAVGRIQAEEDEHDRDSRLIKRHAHQSEESEDTKIRLLFERVRSLCFDQIGGLRTDPFNALPVENKGDVPVTFDFLAQHWAHIDMSDMQRGSDGRPILYRTYFAALLNDPMLFEVMMAFCMLMQSLHRGALPKLSPEALYHTSNCVAMLRDRLHSDGEKSISDMVLCTIVVLGAIAVTTYDFKSLESHVTGMRRIIVLRGGHDKLGWDGYVATRCRQIEAGWLSVQKLENERKENGADSVDKLIYPSHPFSTDLCARLAQLPSGFSDLALGGKISLRFISIIEDIMAWDRKTGTKATSTSPITLPAMFLAVPGQKQIEALLALSFLAYCAFTERRLGRSQPASEGALEFYSKDIINDADIWTLKNQDAFIWGLLTLAGTTDPKSEIYKWSQCMLNEIKPTGKKREALGKAFFTIAVAQ